MFKESGVSKLDMLLPPGVSSVAGSLGLGEGVEDAYSKYRDSLEGPDTQVVNNLNSIKSELAKELGIKNLDIKKADPMDATGQAFRKWDAKSPGLASGWDQNSGKRWGLNGVFDVEVPHGLQWLAGSANRIGNSAASLLGNVAHSGGQVVSRGYDAVAQDNPTIVVYPDGQFELYDNAQHLKELGGHGVLTAANAFSLGVGGKIIGGVGRGAVAGASRMGANLGSKLTPKIMQKIGITATGQLLRTTARNATAATIKKLPTSWRGPAVNLANLAGRSVKPLTATGAVVGGYNYGGNILDAAEERGGTMDQAVDHFGGQLLDAQTPQPNVGATGNDYVPPAGYFSEAQSGESPSSEATGMGKWMLPTLLAGGGGLAMYNMMKDDKKPAPLSKEELEERRRKRESNRSLS